MKKKMEAKEKRNEWIGIEPMSGFQMSGFQMTVEKPKSNYSDQSQQEQAARWTNHNS